MWTLNHLLEMRLVEVRLKRLPPECNGTTFPRLRVLVLRKNYMCRLHPYALAGMTALQELRIEKNLMRIRRKPLNRRRLLLEAGKDLEEVDGPTDEEESDNEALDITYDKEFCKGFTVAQLRKELHKRQVRHTGLYKEDSTMLQSIYARVKCFAEHLCGSSALHDFGQASHCNALLCHSPWQDNEYAVRYLQRERDEDNSCLGMEAGEEDEARNENFSGELGPASSIWLLPSLRILSLSDNGKKIETVPLEVGQMATLKVLDLSNNTIRRLPRSIGAMTGLETILVGRNLLRTLPQEFALMKGLRHLNVSHNRLEFLPPAFGRLQLEEFFAADNQLDEIAEVQLTGGWNVCKVLTEHNVDFFFSPSDLSRTMHTMWLQSNSLQCLPQSFAQMRLLRNCQMSDNPLRCPPLDIVDRDKSKFTRKAGAENPVLAVHEYFAERKRRVERIVKYFRLGVDLALDLAEEEELGEALGSSDEDVPPADADSEGGSEDGSHAGSGSSRSGSHRASKSSVGSTGTGTSFSDYIY